MIHIVCILSTLRIESRKNIELNLNRISRSILWLLFKSKLVAVTALSLSAVSGLEGKGGIALSAYLFITVEFFGNCGNGRIHDAASESQDEVKGGFFLDVVVRE